MAGRILRSLAGSGRRRLVAALALVAVVGVVIAVVTGTGSPSPGKASSDPGVSGAATVRRRDLVATDTEAGTLSYSGPQTVYDRLSGTITWLPAVGRVIKRGGTLFKVDGEPVILLNGSTPAYRTLSAADSDGADITQLNRNLVDLGFNPDGIVTDDIWQPATTIGVELFQESLGETATGILSLGQIVFLPGDQLVSTVEGTVGAGSGSGGTAADTVAPAPTPEFVDLRTDASTCPGSGTSTTTTTSTSTTSCTTTDTTSTTTTPTTPAITTPTTPPATGQPRSGRRRHRRHRTVEQTLAALTALLKAESAQLKAQAAQLRADQAAAAKGTGGAPRASTGSGSPASSTGSGSPTSSTGSGSPTSSSGNGGASNDGSAVLETTSTHLVVTVDLSASSQSEAVVGERVTVELPAGNTVSGRITAVSPVAQSSSGSGSGNSGSGSGGSGGGGGGGSGSGGSSSTIPVTITLRGHHSGAGLDEAAVSVNFAQQRARNVLSVPVTALLATAGGNFAVQTTTKPHQLIPVTTGLFAAGYVQISGPGVYSGLQVTDSQG